MQKLRIWGVLLLVFFGIGSGVAQVDGFGVGILVGEPTGITGKYWLDRTNALDGAIAWSFIDEGSFYIHANYVHHHFEVIDLSSGEMPIYYGGGLKLKVGDDAVFGFHVPLGIAYHFEEAPLDVFIEIRPGLNLTPKTEFDMSGGIGVRYYFN
jgi:hypothetical protein